VSSPVAQWHGLDGRIRLFTLGRRCLSWCQVELCKRTFAEERCGAGWRQAQTRHGARKHG